jgi:hypothetical protein
MNDFGIVYLKDERFDSAQTREMQLLIKITPQRISYAIINDIDNSLVVLYDSPVKDSIDAALDNLLRTNSELKSSFAKVKVSVHTPHFTLLPAQYFTITDLPEYEKLIQARGDTKTFVTSINKDSIKCIIALKIKDTAPITSAFPDVRLFSQVEPLAEMGLRLRDTNAHKLVLHFNDQSFEACLISDEKLVFNNIYAIKNADDFNYYLLMIREQLAIDTKNTSVILAGNIESAKDHYKRVEKYFKDVRFADSTEIVNFSRAFDKISKHRHFSLLGLSLCE